MQARFTSSTEFSDSFSSPYYNDNRINTLKRKELLKNGSLSNVNRIISNANNNGTAITNTTNTASSSDRASDTTNQSPTLLPVSSQSQTGEPVAEDSASCDNCQQEAGSPVENPQKRFSLPKRSVSFSDFPELVNQSTEVVAL